MGTFLEPACFEKTFFVLGSELWEDNFNFNSMFDLFKDYSYMLELMKARCYDKICSTLQSQWQTLGNWGMLGTVVR